MERTDWDLQLDHEARQRREVFARFGLASYQAQCVEKQIGLLLASTFNRKFLRSTPDEREVFFSREAKKTLGRLVRELQARIDVPDDLREQLDEGLVARNWLAHDYFWDRARELLSFDGREKMIAELTSAATSLDKLDCILTGLAERWSERLGVDVEAAFRH